MKKHFFTFGTVVFCALSVFAQTPYDNFAPEQSVKSMIELPKQQFKVENTNPNSEVHYAEFDNSTLSLNLLNKDDSVLKTVTLNPNDKKFLTIDPHAEKYYNISPYAYCSNNPILYIDPTGMSYSEFDANGNYLRTIKDNWWHYLWHGRTGRIVDGEGNVTQKFKFADPKNDVKDLKEGNINRVQFVQESEITSMLSKAGAFTEENKAANADSRYGYISEEGKGYGKFDFAANKTTGIPAQYSDVSQSLFLVDGVAHNHFNYGNFLFGAAGRALGVTLFELQAGAHYNSLANPDKNGYKRQLDSRDDQFSIRMGVRHANQYGYKNMFYRVIVGPLQYNGYGY
jgi:hypothetical protein